MEYTLEDQRPNTASIRKNHEKALQKYLDQGENFHPISVTPRAKLAKTKISKAWCNYIHTLFPESPSWTKGRAQLRQNAIFHIQMKSRNISTRIMGETLFECQIQILSDIPSIPKDLIDPLTGLPDSNKIIPTLEQHLPAVEHIHMECNCLEFDDFCSHIAASLYGFSLQLDQEPTLLWQLLDLPKLCDQISKDEISLDLFDIHWDETQ